MTTKDKIKLVCNYEGRYEIMDCNECPFDNVVGGRMINPNLCVSCISAQFEVLSEKYEGMHWESYGS